MRLCCQHEPEADSMANTKNMILAEQLFLRGARPMQYFYTKNDFLMPVPKKHNFVYYYYHYYHFVLDLVVT